MEDKKEALLRAVKIAVTRYGISDVSTRNIAEIAKVSDSSIYRCFKDKEEMLLQAYIKENGEIFDSMLAEIDRAHALPLSFGEKAKLSMHKIWRELLSDMERLYFCVTYFHSNYFAGAIGYHNEQLRMLSDRLSIYFPSKEDCERTMNSLCSLLYDSAYAIYNGRAEDTEEYARYVFETEQAILLYHINSHRK